MITKDRVLELDPIRDKKVIAQFFHNMFYAIPEENWCMHILTLTDKQGNKKYCAMGFSKKLLDLELFSDVIPSSYTYLLMQIFSPYSIITVNDIETLSTPGKTPKARILNFLQKIIDA